MDHPQQRLLDEFSRVIEHLVPLTPENIKEEAVQWLVELSRNPHATERQIHQALIALGKKEFPYRKAYEALCGTDEEQRFSEAVFHHLPHDLADRIREITKHGVHITDYVQSPLFLKLPDDERYLVEQALHDAHDVVNRQCGERAEHRGLKFSELVTLWTKKRDVMDGLIVALREMATRDPQHSEEILEKAALFEQGWSVLAKDPEEKEIRSAIASFAQVLEEYPDDDMATL